MTIIIGGAVTLNRVASRTATTRIGDTGAVERTRSYSCQTAKRWHTLAQAKAIERQLHELAVYARLTGGIYIDSDEYDLDDGLYAILSIDTKTQPDTTATFIVTCDLTLRRVGGAGAGGNIDRRVYPSASLQSNSWSIASTPWYALPVGTTGLDVAASATLTGADGAVPLVQSSSANRYVLNAASYNVGECKVWDTAGDFDPASFTPSGWARIYANDYRFAQPYHWSVDNGFLRLTAQNNLPASTYGVLLEFYDTVAAAWKTMSTSTSANSQISCQFNGSTPTAWLHSELIEVTPERVKVKVWMTASTFLPTITYTLERGKRWCLVETTSASSTTLGIGLTCTNSRYVFNRFLPASSSQPGAIATGPSNDCINHLYPATTLWTAQQVASTNGDNWIASVHPAVNVLRFVGIRTTTPTLTKPATTNGGLLASQTSTTSLAAYVGAVYYNATTVSIEAEAGSLTGATTPANDATASPGTGNNYVLLDALNEQVEVTGAPYAFGQTSGLRIRAYWRVKNAAVSAGNTIRTAITYAGSEQSSSVQTITDAILGTATTWKWIFSETSAAQAWNGTDAIKAQCKRSVAGNTDAVFVDECVIVCISDGLLSGPYDMAHAALTEMTTWQSSDRIVV